MPRKARLFSSSETYHIVIRGNNKQNIFYDTEDYNFFIKRMVKYLKETEIELYAYCLMTNHVHLAIGKASKTTLVTFMRKLEVSYTYYFNTKYERVGHLFQDRYKSEPINTSRQFQKTIRYILQNPILGGLATSINYDWNSYKTSLQIDSIINKDILTREFGNLTNYMNFITENINDKCMDYENKPRKTDRDCLNFLKQKYKIHNPMHIDKFTQNQKQKILLQLKNKGFSIRSISRITGISRKIIQMA